MLKFLLIRYLYLPFLVFSMRILVYYYQEALYCTTSNNLPITFNMYDLLPVILFQYIEIFSQPWRRSRFRGSGVTEVGDLRPVCWPPVSHLRSNMPVSQAEDTGVGRLFWYIWLQGEQCLILSDICIVFSVNWLLSFQWKVFAPKKLSLLMDLFVNWVLKNTVCI